MRRTLLLTLLVTSLLASVPALAKEWRVRLKFTPHDLAMGGAPIGVLSGKTFQLAGAKDGRTGPLDVIGESADGAAIVTEDPVAVFTAGIAREVLPQMGVTFLPSDPDYLVSMTLETFRVNAADLYTAEVVLHWQVATAMREPLWEGETRGEARLVGKAGREVNVTTVLSDAIKQALLRFVTDASLSARLAAGRPRVVAGPRGVAAPAPATRVPQAQAPDAITPAALLAELQRLHAAGLGDDTLADFVRQRTLAHELTADDILAWRAAGIGEGVIRVALSRVAR